MALEFTTSFIQDSLSLFRYYKRLAERAMEQVTDEQLFAAIDKESNSIAVIVKHMAGNMLSRWTDFLTTDGEKPDRDRDAEFETGGGVSRGGLLARWEEGWERLFTALGSLTPADLRRTVTLRGEPQTVPQAIHRQLTHQAYHVGQLVLLAKHFAGAGWQSLTVPKGKSRERNAEMFRRWTPR